MEFGDPAAVRAAVAGADRVLLVSGMDPGGRVEQHRNVIDAAREADTGLVAYTSIVNAASTTIGLAADHQATEQLLRDSGVPYVLLRNSWYHENYTSRLPAFLGAAPRVGWISAHRVPLSQNRTLPIWKVGSAPVELLIVTPNKVGGTAEGGIVQAGPVICWAVPSGSGRPCPGLVKTVRPTSRTVIPALTSRATVTLPRRPLVPGCGGSDPGAWATASSPESSVPVPETGRATGSPTWAELATTGSGTWAELARVHSSKSRAISSGRALHALAIRSIVPNSGGTDCPVQYRATADLLALTFFPIAA